MSSRSLSPQPAEAARGGLRHSGAVRSVLTFGQVAVSALGLYAELARNIAGGTLPGVSDDGWFYVLLSILALPALAAAAALLFMVVRGVRALWAWGAPLRTLFGVAMLAIPAACFPPRAGRQWLGDALEAFVMRREVGMSYPYVLGNYLLLWPVELLRAWRDFFETEQQHADHAEPVTPSWWTRHGQEVLWAAAFGALFLVGLEILVAYLHSVGQVLPWDRWFAPH
ncbi:hypothetical protein ABT358_02420 [Streptomyces sp. NPDC000341]|uniref:hypothetical protein n=1 Tax=Streptomyces sp. NPDC000341 TaxID=3156645 RepID=UPI00332880A5